MFASLPCTVPNMPFVTVSSQKNFRLTKVCCPFVLSPPPRSNSTLAMNQIVQVDPVRHDTDPDAAYAETVAKGVVMIQLSLE